MEAQKIGFDYIGFGPMFQTKTKEDALSSREFDYLELALKESSIPVLSIGGKVRDNLELLPEREIKHFAVSSVILEEYVAKNIYNFIKLFKKFICVLLLLSIK